MVVKKDKLEVLVVEDSPSICSELKRRIEQELDYTVHVAQTFAEARQLLDDLADRIYLASLDLSLPDALDGEVVDYVRGLGVPSVVFTASLDPKTRARVLSKDVIDYVVKDGQAVDNLVNLMKNLELNRDTGVLVVDDSEASRKHLRRLLELYSFKVYEAEDAVQALGLFKETNDIALAIVDYEMPGKDGVALTRSLRSRYAPENLSIIGVSGAGDKRMSVRFLKSGANDFLAKGFTREEFHCRVMQSVDTLRGIRRLHELSEIKDRFLGMAAHDLRTPISGIIGFNAMLLDGMCGQISEEQRRILQYVQTASRQMNDLVNDLLDISVIESGKLDLNLFPVASEEYLQERLRICAMMAEKKGIKVESEIGELPPVLADAARLVQVFDNLLGNAVKFSPADTTIRVEAHAGDEVLLYCVRDQGPGIDPEEKELLFHGFQKLSARPTGDETSTGLGLAIAEKIVLAHGGRIWVESKPGEGATFYFTIPLAS